MLLLDIDVGTSSIKVSVVDVHKRKTLSSIQYPEAGHPVISKQTGLAEQSLLTWWEEIKSAINKSHATKLYDPADIKTIGISYQMHNELNDMLQDKMTDKLYATGEHMAMYGHEY